MSRHQEKGESACHVSENA